MSVLELKGVSVKFGGLLALSKVGFSLNPGEVLGLIGPNGAGKTTVFNVITGVYKVSNGEAVFGGDSIIGKRPHQILAMGIARTFQNIRLFSNMTALENAMVALHCRSRKGVVGAILRSPSQKREEREIENRAMEVLRFMGVEQYAYEVARNLPYGLQRRLEIARALASSPKAVLLDEPAAGMNPSESKSLTEIIGRIADVGISVLLVEHDMKVVMEICDRIVCIDHGEKIAERKPEEIQRDPKVIEAYLGQPPKEAANHNLLCGPALADSLKIGSMSPLTGSYAADGNDIANGARIAVAIVGLVLTSAISRYARLWLRL